MRTEACCLEVVPSENPESRVFQRFEHKCQLCRRSSKRVQRGDTGETGITRALVATPKIHCAIELFGRYPGIEGREHITWLSE